MWQNKSYLHHYMWTMASAITFFSHLHHNGQVISIFQFEEYSKKSRVVSDSFSGTAACNVDDV